MSKEKRIIKKLKEYPLEENVNMDKDEFEEYLDNELEKVNKDLEGLDEEIKLLEKEIEERGEYKADKNNEADEIDEDLKYDTCEDEDMERRHNWDDRDMDDNKIIEGS